MAKKFRFSENFPCNFNPIVYNTFCYHTVKEVCSVKKIICKKEYDTETATLIKKTTHGDFGAPAGYEETLYQTPGGLYFLYFCGGEASGHAGEDIARLAKTKVKDWMNAHE